MTKTFKVSNYRDLRIGFGFLSLTLAYLLLVVFESEAPSRSEMTISISLIATSIIFISSYFTVKLIKLSDDEIILYPAKIHIERGDIIAIKAKNTEGLNTSGKLDGIELKLRHRRFSWVPLNVLMMGGHASIRVLGVREGRELHAAIFAMEINKDSRG